MSESSSLAGCVLMEEPCEKRRSQSSQQRSNFYPDSMCVSEMRHTKHAKFPSPSLARSCVDPSIACQEPWDVTVCITGCFIHFSLRSTRELDENNTLHCSSLYPCQSLSSETVPVLSLQSSEATEHSGCRADMFCPW